MSLAMEKVLVGRWQSRGGKYWLELYAEYAKADRSLAPGYSYRADDGGGYIGTVSEADAIKHVERCVLDYVPSKMARWRS